ncbi:MAG: hypothetical protein ACRCT8_08555 [Lacipirellulaceae bacterium]
MKLYASRSQVELSETFELLLEITNAASESVWITDFTTTCSLPGEVRFPRDRDTKSSNASFPTVSGAGVDLLCLSPRTTYTVLWRVNNTSANKGKRRSIFRIVHDLWEWSVWHLFFHPGTYDLQAQVHLFVEQPDAAALYRAKFSSVGEEDIVEYLEPREVDATHVGGSRVDRMLETKKDQALELKNSIVCGAVGRVEVATHSLTILLAAAIGGFAAFQLSALSPGPEPVGIQLAQGGWLLYVLVAVVLTLFLSRVSEARFPLTIRVMDFWGALSLGVLTAFGGIALIGRILKLASGVQ